MPSNYLKADPVFGQIDLDDEYIQDSFLIDRYTGNGLYLWGDVSARGVFSEYLSIPTQIGSMTNWNSVGSSAQISFGIKTDGTLWSWGGFSNYDSIQNGIGTGIIYSSPVQVGSMTNWKTISCARYSAFALKTDGTLWVWGFGNQNSTGAWGIGIGGYGQPNISTPIQVGSMTNWKMISAGAYDVTAAIKTDGTLWSWGRNDCGQLGQENIIYRSSPCQVGISTDWKWVSTSPYAVHAIKTDGTLWGAGAGEYIGLGNINLYSSLVQIGTSTNWKVISAGFYAYHAIKTDGTLWAWGENWAAQLGTSNDVVYSSPVQVGLLTDWKMVAHGNYHGLATKTDGSLWGWGISNSSPFNTQSPVRAGSGTNWKMVAAGNGRHAAISNY